MTSMDTFSSLEMWLREKFPRWDCEHRAADRPRVRVQRVRGREPVLERHVLALRVVHEGEEEQAVVGVVAAAQDRRLRGDADVRAVRELVEDRWVVEAAAGQRRARSLVAADDLLLLVLGERVPGVVDDDAP